VTKILDEFPGPLLDDIVEGRCVPIIGAGFSLNASLPAGQKMPDWNTLGGKIAEAMPGYTYTTPIDALSAYEHEFGRTKLVEALERELLVDVAQPGETHRSFCKLPFDRVVTTNFEFLLETAYTENRLPMTSVILEDQLPVRTNTFAPRLLKLHGDLRHPRQLVATEEDYDGFLTRFPLFSTSMANLLIERTPLFIGYSLDDPDFRQIWQIVKDRLGKLGRPAFVLQVDATTHVIRRYERRDVKVVNLPRIGVDYSSTLTQAFTELREYWTRQIIAKSTTSDDETQAALRLPIDTSARLCFVSVPAGLVAIYKLNIFPVIERYGFTPIMAADVTAPGENIFAKLTALIERADLVLVDATSPGTVLELGLAAARSPAERKVVVVVDRSNRWPAAYRDFDVIVRPPLTGKPDEAFVKKLEKWLGDAAKKTEHVADHEADRLLAKGEFKAAVIAAFSDFEQALRSALEPELAAGFEIQRIAVRGLLKLAVDAQRLSTTEAEKIFEANYIRNKIVHENKTVSAASARRIVKLLKEVSLRFRKRN